jgi:hypothetical protein
METILLQVRHGMEDIKIYVNWTGLETKTQNWVVVDFGSKDFNRRKERKGERM